MSQALPCSCLCGAVHFDVEPPVEGLIVCHCRHCQKVSGGAPGYLVAVPRAAVHASGSGVSVHTITGDSGMPVHRHYCAKCGSPLWSEPEAAPDKAYVKVGAFDTDPGLTPTRDICLASAPPWHRLPDGNAPPAPKRPIAQPAQTP